MKKFLGIELGSTRIKAVLINENHKPIASGSFDWENRFENGYWTYHLDDVWTGIQACYKALAAEYSEVFKEPLTEIDCIGISAMMHGYLPFGKNMELLTPFRTWRNITTSEAAAVLTENFRFNIPQRWSIAHYYQAILNGEEHVKDIKTLTTLAGYVHFRLTGKHVLGMNDASGMFPVENGVYNAGMIAKFNNFTNGDILSILPRIMPPGVESGSLTAEAVRLLDSTRTLKPGIPFCPPEGDAGTGMVATNSITERTGNISAGTSVFAMVVLEKQLANLHTEIDMQVTPAGKPVAMVHGNNCTSDLDAWVNLLGEAAAMFNDKIDKNELYTKLYQAALNGDADCSGLFACNYIAGEHLTGFDEGRPLFARGLNSRFTLANFMRTHLFSAMATLKIGMEILTEQEGIELDLLQGHGGLFKTKDVGQKLMAGALNVPISVMESAGEGGAWGIALLAAYCYNNGGTLEDYLEHKVFANHKINRIEPDKIDVTGFAAFLERYKNGLEVERVAVKYL